MSWEMNLNFPPPKRGSRPIWPKPTALGIETHSLGKPGHFAKPETRV